MSSPQWTPAPADAPLVSVVMPTFNSAATLDSALESLAGQSWRDFELIVCDGVSGDATLAIARQWAPQLPSVHIDSRPDRGVYDAINRGVAMARGHWFLVLGSDDRLHAPETLALVAPALTAAAQSLEWVYGDVLVMAENPTGLPAGGRFAGPVPLPRLCRMNICQQAIFYRRSLFTALGGFDLRYRIYADWDFNLRAAFRAPAEWIDLVVADYAATGMSTRETDPLFVDHRPELIRRELAARPFRADLWPVQRQLLSDANRQWRAGRRRRGLGLAAAYLRLLALRLPALLGVGQARP